MTFSRPAPKFPMVQTPAQKRGKTIGQHAHQPQTLSIEKTRLYDRILEAAHLHAKARQCSVDRLLIHTEALSEHDLYRHIAAQLDVPFIAYPVLLDPSISPTDAMAAGLAPVFSHNLHRLSDEPDFIYAPQGERLDWLITHPRRTLRSAGTRIAITTPTAFKASIRASVGTQIADAATYCLPVTRKKSTASSLQNRFWILILVAFASLLIASAIFTALLWSCALAMMSCFPIIPGVALKIAALNASSKFALQTPILPDHDLPTYSILVPIYREARIVDQLIQALISISYPREKLDVKLLLESDDVETLSALEALALPKFFDIVICPPGQPRTKPRALSIGLAYATSDLIVAYDAEDIPDCDQLKKAASIFSCSDKNLACLQAHLTIDNLADSWLTYHFALEYAGLFDVMLNGFTRLKQPIPLGGTSNHFRRDALIAVGGWDPWNVTEDADLGLRLYRSGYRVQTFNSTTQEEAPATLKAWLNQRTRWLKGWMQTSAIHLQSHGKDLDRMQLKQRCALALAASFAPISILFNPILIFAITFALNKGIADHTFTAAILMMIYIGIFLASLICDGIITTRGARVRGIKMNALRLLGLVPYSILKTFAAWRALFELIYAPFYWRKTPHGLAKTSRREINAGLKTAF